MDNNPFRSGQQQSFTGNNYGQPQQPQQQQFQPQQQQLAPYQTMSYTGYNGYQQPQTQQFQPQSQQQPQQQPQQQWNSFQGLDSTNSNSIYNPNPTFNGAYLNNSSPSYPQQNNISSLSTAPSVTPSTPFSPYNTVSSLSYGNNTYNQGMPNPLSYTNNQYPYGQQQQQQNDNFYIPPNFGLSTTTTTTPANNNNTMFQPRHPPVDASTFLKGTEIRRVECPVCKKMLEGDDMAVNHHVNEHYS